MTKNIKPSEIKTIEDKIVLLEKAKKDRLKYNKLQKKLKELENENKKSVRLTKLVKGIWHKI